jgi:tRNA(fMet)-specific endonuclease VapC
MSTPSTSSAYLFDTSVLVDVHKGDAALDRRMQSTAGVAYLSSVALGELLYGAKHSAHPATSLAQTRRLTQALVLLQVDATTAEHFGDIKHDLALRGAMIPHNDVWIAATALQFNLTVATRDQHFSCVTGLLVAQW